MTDPIPPIQTDEQPKAGSEMEGMPVDPILKSPGTHQHAGELIAPIGRLDGGEQLLSTANKSTTAPLTTAGAAGSSRVEAVVTSIAPESRAENLAVPKE